MSNSNDYTHHIQNYEECFDEINEFMPPVQGIMSDMTGSVCSECMFRDMVVYGIVEI